MSERLGMLLVLALATPALAQSPGSGAPEAIERVTFDEAVQRAVQHNPTVGQAAQAILRTQALLDQARSVYRPRVYATAGTTILDDERGFSGNVTQPQTQSTLSGTVEYELSAARWAQARQAADQLEISRISAEETRRQVAVTAAEAYLAVIVAEHQRDIALRTRDTAQALEQYAAARLEVGQGSRLNHVRASQELATAAGLVQASELGVRRAEEALGVAIYASGPVQANGDPDIRTAQPPAPADGTWLTRRPDVHLLSAQVEALDRVVRDTWKSWLPTATAEFTPQYVTPAGFFEPQKTWRARFELQIPIYDGTIGSTRRLRQADRDSARLRLDAVTLQARSEVRLAQEAITINEQMVESSRAAAASAADALHITEVAYKAGASTNIEVVQAQQVARSTEITAALAEHRLRQARLDLLVALGEFPTR